MILKFKLYGKPVKLMYFPDANSCVKMVCGFEDLDNMNWEWEEFDFSE